MGSVMIVAALVDRAFQFVVAGGFVALVLTVGFAPPAASAPIQIFSPAEFTVPTTTINFDGYDHLTAANDLYLAQGVRLTRDDLEPVFIYDWAALGRATTSPPNVLATVKALGMDAPWATHLNLYFDSPMNELGMHFGNDQGFGGFTRATLSVFDASDALLGTVGVDVSNNPSVDQSLGLISSDAFVRARIDYDGARLAVAVDDLAFGAAAATVPDSSLLLLGMGVTGLAAWRKRRV